MKKDSTQQFETHFAASYGERWPQLRAALLSASKKISMINPFGLQEYALDPASLYPIEQLDLRPELRIADFCASPGGKALAGIFALRGQGEWFCNDLSPGRVSRLKAVLHDCLPPEILARVRVSCSDASRWGLRWTGEFDRVLVDAPCSGERHLLASPQELARWSLKGSKRLAIRQHALLCSAVDCLRPGGRLVYSTCSISEIENDLVIDKLLKSRRAQIVVAKSDVLRGEATRHGRIFLPDTEYGGPIYLCAVTKLQ